MTYKVFSGTLNPAQSTNNCSHVCVCVAVNNSVVHNAAQNISDNFPCYPPDNHHHVPAKIFTTRRKYS